MALVTHLQQVYTFLSRKPYHLGENIVGLAHLGKWLVAAGLALAVIGLVLWLAGKWGLPLGRLPGDIQLQGRRWTFFFPITTCIVLSIVLTVILNLVIRWFR